MKVLLLTSNNTQLMIQNEKLIRRRDRQVAPLFIYDWYD